MVRTYDTPKVRKKVKFKDNVKKTRTTETKQKPITGKQQEHLWQFHKSCGITSAETLEIVSGINLNPTTTNYIETEVITLPKNETLLNTVDPAYMKLPMSDEEEEIEWEGSPITTSSLSPLSLSLSL